MKENNLPLVSFVMNCYNGEKYLHRSLDSIIKQTYLNWELVFWDNASTDRSKEIFESYKDSRFKYFQSKENVSLGQARAWAVDVCQGEYIAFLDVDDEWAPLKTEIQIRELLNDNYVLSYCGVVEIDAINTEHRHNMIPQYESGYLFEDQLRNFEINLPAAIIKRQALIDKNLNFDPSVKASEEYCLFMQMIYDEKVCVIKEPLAYYYKRKDSLTNECMDRWGVERFYTLDKIKNTHPEAEQKYSAAFILAVARGHYYNARFLMSNKKKKEARSVLSSIKHIDKRYYFLYFLTFFPLVCWNYIHYLKNLRYSS